MIPDELKTADELLAEQTNTSDRMLAYQRRWESELPGNPSMAFVGIFLALVVFCCMASMPWIMSYLQDEGIIHPKIHLRYFGPPKYLLPENVQEHPLHVAPGQTSVFGRPRDNR